MPRTTVNSSWVKPWAVVLWQPPNGHNHPLWTWAMDCARDDRGRQITSQHLYTRCTTSTTLQLAYNHTFTGSYSKCFSWADTPEFHSCLCGYGLRNANHLILHCPWHTHHRINAGIAGHYNPPTLTQLFSTKRGVAYLLDFLQSSQVATTPECSPEPMVQLHPEPKVPPEHGLSWSGLIIFPSHLPFIITYPPYIIAFLLHLISFVHYSLLGPIS